MVKLFIDQRFRDLIEAYQSLVSSQLVETDIFRKAEGPTFEIEYPV